MSGLLAEQAQKQLEVSREYLQVGFTYASKVGELLNEVENLVGAEEFETWLKNNCSDISPGEARKYMKLFEGEKVSITLTLYTEKKEVE